MTRILHLSDLHFGTEKSNLVELVLADYYQLKPDVVVISGDLTQRARVEQYRAVSEFLSKFNSQKLICVPGNHDISLYNLLERFFYPFTKYKKWVNPNLCASYEVDNLSILGLNSVTPYKPMGGYITEKQLALVIDYFKSQPENNIKIVIMHHNLIKSERHKIINDADKILNVFAEAHVNIVLSGHIHFSYIELLKKEFLKNNLYIITSGTPISFRTSALNSYNILDVSQEAFTLTIKSFQGDRFITASEKKYHF